jgi:hypothetical protein
MTELANVIVNGDAGGVDALRRSLQAGAGAVTGVYRPAFVDALAQLRGSLDFQVYPVVPNAAAYVRDLADLGMVGAVLKRLRRLRLTAWPELAAYGIANVRRVLAQDFGAMLDVMIQLELPHFASLRPPAVFLHAQMTDLLLACSNEAALRSYARLIRRHGAEPGLQTRNFGHLVPRLRAWNVGISLVVAPFNARGYGMHPSQAECEALLVEGPLSVVAEDVVAQGAVGMAEAAEYARSHGLSCLVLEPQAVAGWGGDGP